MDFDDFMRGFGGDFFEQSPEGADWMQTHEHLTPIIRHLVAGVEGGHISAGQMIDGLYALAHPDISPQALDVKMLFSAAAHAIETPSIIDFFHDMHIIHVPGAFALMCATHNKIDCPCGLPPTRSLADATDVEKAAVHHCIKACFAVAIPDELHVEGDGDDFRIVRYNEQDFVDKPELMDKLVRNFRRELDDELPTVIPEHEKPDDKGGLGRWM